MKETLFDFLTIRHISKFQNKAQKAVTIESPVVAYLTQSNLSIKDRLSYLEKQWSNFKNRSLVSLSAPMDALVNEFRADDYSISPTTLETKVQKIFGMSISSAFKDANFAYQFSNVQSAYFLATLKTPNNIDLSLSDAVRVIYALKQVVNKKVSTVQEIAAIWKTRISLDAKLLEFYASARKSTAPLPASSPGLPDPREAAYLSLQTELTQVNKAIAETQIQKAEEVSPVILSQENDGKVPLLAPRFQVIYNSDKVKSFSPETITLIQSQGWDTGKLEVDVVRDHLVRKQQVIAQQMTDFYPPAVIEKTIINGKLVNIKDMSVPNLTINPAAKFDDPNYYVKPLGLGELKRVEQVNMKYEAGEIAHVENILQGELKVRDHVRKTSTLDVVEEITDREEITENHLETTDRYELSSETEKLVNESSKFDASLGVNISYGPFLEINADTSYGTEESKQTSNSTSSNFAKETVEKAAQRVREAVNKRRMNSVSTSIKETNRHELNNIGGNGHVVGIYRWLNKKYDAIVRTKGLRMMYEFMLPEPAAFHIFAESRKVDTRLIFEEPIKPQFNPFGAEGDHPLKPEHLVESTYAYYGTKYKVYDLSPPPVSEIMLTQSLSEKLAPESGNTLIKKMDMDIPAGYMPHLVVGSGNLVPGGNRTMGVVASIGKLNIHGQGLSYDVPSSSHSNNFTLVGMPQFDQFGGTNSRVEARKLAISVVIYDASGVSMTLVVRCVRTADAMRQWQMETYSQIMAGYEAMRMDYEEKLRGFQYSQGIVIGGNNPLENKRIAETELKKQCISLLTRSYLDKYDHLRGNPVTLSDGSTVEFPEMDFDKTHANANEIQFLEQAFEWNNMMYNLYPYFWTPRNSWLQKRANGSSDPQFAEFLRAGAARMILAVRQGYEEAVAQFLQTGIIPRLDTQISYGESLFVDIIDLLKEEQDKSVGEIIDQWEVTIPTNLVILDDETAIARVERVMNIQEV